MCIRGSGDAPTPLFDEIIDAIAASAIADELLAALKDLLEAYERHDRFSMAAREAIAKAEGHKE